MVKEIIEFEVPIDFQGSGSGGGKSGGSKASKDNENAMKDNTKAVATGNIIADMILKFMGEALGLLKPLIKVLNVLFMVIFLPLMPLIMSLTESVVMLIDGLLKLFGGEISFMDFLIDYVGPAFIAAVVAYGEWTITMLKGIWSALAEVGVWIFENIIIPGWETLAAVGIWIWENIIKPPFEFLANMIYGIWDLLVNAWSVVVDFFKITIPEKMMAAWEWVKDIGTKIWDIIKTPFVWLKNKLKSMINGIIRMVNKVPGVSIPRLAEGGIVTKPTLALIGEAGPEAVVPLGKGIGGGDVIINNPSVRNDGDIKKIADQVSRVLANKQRNRFS